MITKIEIQGPATFKELVSMDGLKKVNFVYGSNGSGKTTISKVIDNLDDFENCSLQWASGKAATLVYNKDFVKENFHEEEFELKGVFTLGKDAIASKELIENLKKEIDELRTKISDSRIALGNEESERGQLTEEFHNNCWEYMKLYKDRFKKAFKNNMGSKPNFAEHMLEQWRGNQTELLDLAQLEARAKTVYDDEPKEVELIANLDFSELTAIEVSPILEKKIIGKEDVDIAAMIQKLENSDWVSNGIPYFEKNDGVCPFCQEKTPETFQKNLEDYFDDSYVRDIDALKFLTKKYSAYAETIKEKIQSLQGKDTTEIAAHAYIDQAALASKHDLLREVFRTNIGILNKKQNEPSSVIRLQSLNRLAQEISDLINAANAKIRTHNNNVTDHDNQKEMLRTQVWRFLVNEARFAIKTFTAKLSIFDQKIQNIKAEIRNFTAEHSDKDAQLKKQSPDVKDVRPTVLAINKKLKECGFQGFELAEAEELGYYKIIRDNGHDAYQTLSEGEQNFVTFLYFFHLLKGGRADEIEATADRVAVFDDPVSSFDSDTLFTVCTLIREVFGDAVSEDAPISQVFVLTHNIHFLKEVTFRFKKTQSSYWIVRKHENVSKIESCEEAPVKSAYHMLWEELSRPDSSSLTIRNTMRRILEYYFINMVGYKKLGDIPARFPADEQYVCQTLISWLQHGSHGSLGDDIQPPSDADVDQQKRVFKRIFKETGHIEHHELMTGDEAE